MIIKIIRKKKINGLNLQNIFLQYSTHKCALENLSDRTYLKAMWMWTGICDMPTQTELVRGGETAHNSHTCRLNCIQYN